MAPYPRWRYFPSYAAPSAWVDPIVAVFASNRAQIDSAAEHAKRMESNDIPGVIASDLQAHGFDVEQGKQKAGKLPRPVFFGDEGTYLRTYEIDAFEPGAGVALEVEAGRATINAIYRDLVQGSLMVDARFLGARRAGRVPLQVGRADRNRRPLLLDAVQEYSRTDVGTAPVHAWRPQPTGRGGGADRGAVAARGDRGGGAPRLLAGGGLGAEQALAAALGRSRRPGGAGAGRTGRPGAGPSPGAAYEPPRRPPPLSEGYPS